MSRRSRIHYRLLGAGACIAAALVGASAFGVQPEPKKPQAPTTPKPEEKPGAQPAEALPKGEEILDRYVKETGGKAAYDNIKSMEITGQLKLGMGITGEMKIFILRPGKLLTETDFEQIGKTKSGSDGETVWSDNAREGPKILEGEQREIALEPAQISEKANWRERYSQVKCVGVEDVNGKPAYKLELTMKSGNKRTAYYDKESGLLVKQRIVIKSQMGQIPVESTISDYRKVGDILFPHKTTTTMMGQEIENALEKIELNVDIPASKFDLPDEIKELKKEKKTEEPKPVDPAPKTEKPAKPLPKK